jgi:putative metallohydrolase (TIGR04338 family)
VYAAEHLIPGSRERVYETIDDAQARIDQWTSTRWFRARFGSRHVSVAARTSGGSTGSDWGRINLARGSTGRGWSHWNDWVLLHELAHVVQPSGTASHGREFAAIELALVTQFIGEDAGKALRAAFVEKRVKHRWAVKVKHPVASKSAQAERERKQRERDLAALITDERLRYAAKIIRAAAEVGKLGPSGRKPRQHALDTARLLEKGGT